MALQLLKVMVTHDQELMTDVAKIPCILDESKDENALAAWILDNCFDNEVDKEFFREVFIAAQGSMRWHQGGGNIVHKPYRLKESVLYPR